MSRPDDLRREHAEPNGRGAASGGRAPAEGPVSGAESRLQRIESLAFSYRAFLTSRVAVCFTDATGTILDANDTFLDLYGYRLDEVIGRTPRLLKSGRHSPAMYQALWEAIQDPATGFWNGEIVNRCKDGREVTLVLTISAVRDESGQTVGYTASALDVTDRKSGREAPPPPRETRSSPGSAPSSRDAEEDGA